MRTETVCIKEDQLNQCRVHLQQQEWQFLIGTAIQRCRRCLTAMSHLTQHGIGWLVCDEKPAIFTM